jgi:hypothetical protein
MTIQENKVAAENSYYLTIAFQMSRKVNPKCVLENFQTNRHTNQIFDDVECLEIYEQSMLVGAAKTVREVSMDMVVCDMTVRNAITRGRLFHEAGGL